MDFMEKIKLVPAGIKQRTPSPQSSPHPPISKAEAEGEEAKTKRQGWGDERGFVLVLAIIIMAAMTAIGLAVVTTSTTDMMIARNEMESKKAFYLAQSGLEEAMGRMGLSATGGVLNPRFVGENSAEKTARKADTPPYDYDYGGDDFESHSGANALSPAGLGGTYAVEVDYAREAADTWSYNNPADASDDADEVANNEVVLYCFDYYFVGTGVPTNCTAGQPVYKIRSTGTTSAGTRAVVVAYVASSMLNVLPPGNTILFTEGAINGGNNIGGLFASDEGVVAGCDTAECIANNKSGTVAWVDGGMQDYIGVDVNELKNMADLTWDQGAGSPQIPSDLTTGFNTVCSTNPAGATQDDINLHICDNEAKITYIDNVGKEADWAGITYGRGILVVTGDLRISGTVLWEGMIYVMGKLTVSGTVNLFGTIMVDGDNDTAQDDDFLVNGDLNVYGSIEVAEAVGDIVGAPKIVRWLRE